jgi:arabinofuranan 3-O-arabinosyltransferase
VTAATRTSQRIEPADWTEWFMWVGVCMASAYCAVLAAALLQGHWLVDSQGRPLAADFVNVYAAGTLALQGNAAAAYDWGLHKQAEVAALGHAFEGYFGWHYPPTFLFVASLLALLPLLPATLVWLALTLPMYVWAIRSIVPSRAAVLLALSFPGVIWNISVGQNGFLTAALIGGSLLLVERRPVAAGILLGLLTYKPQFGLLFPLALAFGGYWRAIGVATVTALVLAAASCLAFGADSWHAFVAWMPALSNAVFAEGRVGLDKLQTLLGLVRWLGGSMALAWTLQGMLIVGCACVVAWVWRSPVRYEIKAATLVTLALLATPYLFIYDLVVLAIPMAFILQMGLRDGFLRFELAGLAAAALLVLAFPITAVPTGLTAVLTVALMLGRRLTHPQPDESFRA